MTHRNLHQAQFTEKREIDKRLNEKLVAEDDKVLVFRHVIPKVGTGKALSAWRVLVRENIIMEAVRS